jgi:DNA-binding XRE family transcriptional regulator
MRHDARAPAAPDGARDRPYWTDVLRALREARGVTQDGWATWLGVSRKTVQRWEAGAAVPDPMAEEALVELCRQRGLFRAFEHGPLRGLTLTPEMLRDLLAEARLGAAPEAPSRPAGAANSARLITRTTDGRRTAHPLRAPETTIGRGADNDIVVASDLVSRYHARVSWDGRTYVIEDLGSKNGSYVGDQRLTAARPLRHGDEVRLAGREELAMTFDAGDATVTVGHEALPGGGLWVDPRTDDVWLRGRRLDVPPAAFGALAALYERAGEVVSAASIAARAWPERPEADPGAVDDLIEELRQLIEPDPAEPRLLRPEPGGYRLSIV